MTEQEQNEQQPQPESRDEEPVEEEEEDPELLPDREARSGIGGESHGLGPPVP